jgi:hypothetical protein
MLDTLAGGNVVVVVVLALVVVVCAAAPMAPPTVRPKIDAAASAAEANLMDAFLITPPGVLVFGGEPKPPD